MYISHVPGFNEPIKYFNTHHTIMKKRVIFYTIKNDVVLFSDILSPIYLNTIW